MDIPQLSATTNEETDALQRLAVFVTRDIADRRSLLILKQHNASVFRVPAAFIDAPTALELAAIQLLKQQTGIDSPTLPQHLGASTAHLPNDERLLLRATLLRTAPKDDATLMRFSLERGMRVRLVEQQGYYAQVVYEQYHVNDNQVSIAVRRAGWLAANALTDRVQTQLLHFHLADTSDDALHYGWLPLSDRLHLATEQHDWLLQIHHRLKDD